jgi:hypothetical protein
MDRALNQFDILSLLVNSVDSESTLAALARTNTLICSIALDKLWSKLVGAYPLARVMEEDLWYEHESVDDTNHGPTATRVIVRS